MFTTYAPVKTDEYSTVYILNGLMTSKLRHNTCWEICFTQSLLRIKIKYVEFWM